MAASTISTDIRAACAQLEEGETTGVGRLGSRLEELLVQASQLISANPEWHRLQRAEYEHQPIPLRESELLKRSLHAARGEIIDAGARGQINSPEVATSPSIPLEAIAIESFSVKGRDHALVCGPNQDRISVQRGTDLVVATILDGAGNGPLSHLGAEMLGIIIAEESEAIFQKIQKPLLSAQFLGTLHARAYERLHEICQELRLHPDSAHDLVLAATSTIALITPQETLVIGLADGFLKCGEEAARSIEEITKRDPELCCLNIPPFLSQALTGDMTASEYGIALRSIAATSQSLSGEHPEIGELRGNYEKATELHREAFGFRILAHGRTAEIIKAGLILTTDGARETVAPQNHMIAFPLFELLKSGAAGEIAWLANLFNLASTSDAELSRGFSRIDLTRAVIGTPHATARLPGLKDLLKEAVGEEHLSTVESYDFLAREFEADAEALAELLAIDARKIIEFELSQALRQPFRIADEMALVPLSDDLTGVCIKLTIASDRSP